IPIFGGLKIHTYGVLVALGFLVGMWWVSHEAEQVGEDPRRATDLVFYIIIAAIVGSRIAHVLLIERDRFLADPLMIVRIWEGGLVFHGGLVGAVAVSIWYTRRHGRSFWRYADLFAPAIALGHSLGRLGCLAAGCCHGAPVAAAHWWTLTFPPNPQGSAPPGLPLYPTQLIESSGEFLIFLFLVLFRRRLRVPGQLFACYLFLYGILRFFNEGLRGEETRYYLIGHQWTAAQEISLLAVSAAALLWVWCGRRRTHG
ncbi:MAG: prolipoprotein diacylglyceryl transferase, partial [Deltaproteobacteria bacterium]|nr:prolipoprotein diacylglyceryl transferase [Deltaproteobacteria bacterium]